jgi:hypothetical protein
MQKFNASIFLKVDEMIKEYLVFRGFILSFKQFDTERKHDKAKSLQADKIVEHIFNLLHNYEINSFLEFWKYLEIKFFSKWSQKLIHKKPGLIFLKKKKKIKLIF